MVVCVWRNFFVNYLLFCVSELDDMDRKGWWMMSNKDNQKEKLNNFPIIWNLGKRAEEWLELTILDDNEEVEVRE